MSKIKELKENEQNNINVVKILSLFVPEVKNKSKYIDTIVRVYNNDIYYDDKFLSMKLKGLNINDKELDELNKLEKIYLSVLLSTVENVESLLKFEEFCEFHIKNAIENKDLQTYKTFDDIFAEHQKAKFKDDLKKMEKQVVKVIDNDNWLAIIPLTYEASLKYGSNTKWCTASKDYPGHYKSYTQDGTLVYTINKKTNKKFAGYCKIKSTKQREISFWDEKDNKVDGFSCGLSQELFSKINEIFKIGEKEKPKTIEELRKEKLGTTDPNYSDNAKHEVKKAPMPGIYENAASAMANNPLREMASNGGDDQRYSDIYNTIVDYFSRVNH